jgi:AraC family ethanolamine operon transcriptional activator
MRGAPLNTSTEDTGAGMRFVAHQIAGIEDLSESVHGADLVVTQLSAAPCRGSLTHAIDGDMALTLGGFTGDLRLRGGVAPEAVTLAVILERGPSLTKWGLDIQAHDLVVYPVRSEQEARCRGMTRYAVLKAPLEVLQQRAAAFEHLADERCWSVEARLRPARAAAIAQEIARRLERLMRLGPGLEPQAQAGLRDEALEGFLTAVAEAGDREPGRQVRINSARILRQVEDYLDDRTGRGVPIPELCQALGLSRRTLNRAFEEGLGVGPRTYLRLRALSSARKALVAGRQAGASVTPVALDHGFWELGRFSVTYRTMFGESPSQTLRGPARG